MTDADALLDRFLEQARAVALRERNGIELTSEELARLVSDDILRLRFRSRFQREVQDPELRDIIRTYLNGLAEREDEQSDEARVDAEGIDKYVGRVGIGAATAGIAAIVASVGLGAALLLVCGIASFAGSGYSSHRLRRRALRQAVLARRIRMLLEELRDGE